MKITLKKFLVVTEDETELLAQHHPKYAFFRSWPCNDPTDSLYDTESGAKRSIAQYTSTAKRVNSSAIPSFKVSYNKQLKVMPITVTIET